MIDLSDSHLQATVDASGDPRNKPSKQVFHVERAIGNQVK